MAEMRENGFNRKKGTCPMSAQSRGSFFYLNGFNGRSGLKAEEGSNHNIYV
jgi:hypothetical protein